MIYRDTYKGQMWHDIGLGPDFFEVHKASGNALWKRLAAIHADYSGAQSRVAQICTRVEELQRAMVLTVKQIALIAIQWTVIVAVTTTHCIWQFGNIKKLGSIKLLATRTKTATQLHQAF